MNQDDAINAIEARLLQVICQGGRNIRQSRRDKDLREEVLTRLHNYSFRSVPHQVLFDCLWNMPRQRPELIREVLPAWLVQAGFPDFNLAPFFDPHGLTTPQIKKLLDNLTDNRTSNEIKQTGT